MTWERIHDAVSLEELVRILNQRMEEVDYERDQELPVVALTFYVDNAPASQNNVSMDPGLGVVQEIIMPFDAWIVGLAAHLTTNITGGQMDIYPTINTSQLGTGLTLTSDTVEARVLYPKDLTTPANFMLGSDLKKVGVEYDTDGSWAPATLDVQVTLLLELTGGR